MIKDCVHLWLRRLFSKINRVFDDLGDFLLPLVKVILGCSFR